MNSSETFSPSTSADAIIGSAEASYPGRPGKWIEEATKYLDVCSESALRRAKDLFLPEEISPNTSQATEWRHDEYVKLLESDPDAVRLTEYIDGLAREIADEQADAAAQEMRAENEAKRAQELAVLTKTRDLYETCGVDTMAVDRAIAVLEEGK